MEAQDGEWDRSGVLNDEEHAARDKQRWNERGWRDTAGRARMERDEQNGTD